MPSQDATLSILHLRPLVIVIANTPITHAIQMCKLAIPMNGRASWWDNSFQNYTSSLSATSVLAWGPNWEMTKNKGHAKVLFSSSGLAFRQMCLIRTRNSIALFWPVSQFQNVRDITASVIFKKCHGITLNLSKSPSKKSFYPSVWWNDQNSVFMFCFTWRIETMYSRR